MSKVGWCSVSKVGWCSVSKVGWCSILKEWGSPSMNMAASLNPDQELALNLLATA